jgi:ribose transport system permease protein
LIERRRDDQRGGDLLAVSAFYLQIIIGALILAAVAFDQWQARRT